MSARPTTISRRTDAPIRATLQLTALEDRAVPAAPVYTQIPRQTVNEDATALSINLSSFFTDPDGDAISYTLTQTNTTGLITPVVTGANLGLSFAANQYGYSYFRVTATANSESVVGAFEVVVREVDDLSADAFSVSSVAVSNLGVLNNDGTGDNVRQVEAGNLQVVQNDINNNTTSVTVTFPQSTPNLQVRAGSNRADYNIQVGANGTNDVTDGLLFTTVSENGRPNNVAPAGTQYVTSQIDSGSATSDYLIPIFDISTNRDELNNSNVGVSYFPWANGWLGAWTRNSAGTNGGPNNEIRTQNPNSSFTIGLTSNFVVHDRSNGKTTIRIPGISSQTDGLLFALHAKNEGNYTMVRALNDGAWELTVRDNYSNGTDSNAGNEQDPVSFVYMPRNAPNIVSGRLFGNGSATMTSGNFNVVKTGTGTYELTIPGQSPTTGVLMLTAENGNTTTADNVLMYQADGNKFVIYNRDIPASGFATLEDVGDTIPFASFAFVPFLNQPTLRTTSAQSTATVPVLNVSDLGATLTINADGTIKYDPSTSTIIQNLAPETSTTDTFTYTTTTLTGQTTTVLVTVTVTAPSILYVDDAWLGLNNGDSITDANPLATGNQGAIFGTTAFASINAAIAAAVPTQIILINSGTYSEAVVVNKQVQLIFQEGNTTISSLSDTVTNAIITIQPNIVLTIGDASDTTINSVIGGSGGLTKTGTGELTLGGANTYSGPTLINDGAIRAAAADRLSTNSIVNIASGKELRLNGFNQSVGGLSGAGNVTNNSTNNVTLTINTASSLNFTGVISQPNTGVLSIIKTGSGTQQLSAANTYTGSTTINAGVLSVGNSSAFGSNPAVTMGGSGTLAINGFNLTVISLNGSGNVINGSATNATLTVNEIGISTYTGTVSNGSTGSLGIRKTGTGTLNLNGANAYSGGSIISQGTLQTNNSNGVGTGSVTLNDANTATNNTAFLASSNGVTFGNSFLVTNNGTGVTTIGTADGITGAVNTQFNGTITLAKDLTLRAGSADRTTFGGLITGTGNLIITASAAANRISFNHAATTVNNFVGNIDVQSGLFQIGVNTTTANQFIPDNSNLNVAAGASVRFSGTGTESINALTGAGSVTQGDNAGAYTLNIGAANGSGEFSGVLSMAATPSTTFAIVKVGSGTQTFSGVNTYTGTTTVNAGTLLLNNASGSGAGTSVVTVGAFGSLGGTGSVTGAVTVNGRLFPGTFGTTADFAQNNLSFGTNGILGVDLNSTTPNTGHDQVVVTGTVNLTNATLQIYAGTGLVVGDAFTIISNDSTDSVTGSFINGTTIRAVNNQGVIFTVNTAGGDGNDVVLTVSTIEIPRTLDVVSGQTRYFAGSGEANDLSVSVSGSTITITDTVGAITLSPAAITDGWTLTGNSATRSTTGLSPLVFNLGDGANSITSSGTGSINAVFTGTGTLTFTTTIFNDVVVNDFQTIAINGTVTANSFAANTFGTLTNNATGKLKATTVSLAVASGVGTSANNLRTNASTVTYSGNGSLYVTEDNSASFTANTGGISDIAITTLAGTLTIGGATSTTVGNILLTSSGGINVNAALGNANTLGSITLVNNSGDVTIGAATRTNSVISISSADNLIVNANIGDASTVGAITLAANTDGVGTQGLSQISGLIQNVNSSTNSINIIVNTAGGGTGSASIDNINTTGRISANGNGGSILYTGTGALDDAQRGLTNGGLATTRNLVAASYVFTVTGAGSIGSDLRPIQSQVPAANTILLSAGDGGIFWTDWNNPVFLSGATATGPGNIRIATANVGGHNLTVNGLVTTGSGSIYIAADDDLNVNGPIGGPGFSGTVYMAGNRDQGNTMNLRMGAGSSITTSNTTAGAVFLEAFSNNGTAAGGITINNITTGNGGTVRVTTLSANSSGDITAFDSASLINVGSTGNVILIARPYAGTPTGIGSSTTPIHVAGGNITATTTGSTATNGSVFITGTSSTSFAATIGGTGANGGTINLVTTNGLLTINGVTNTNNGNAINLNGAGGVAVNATLGGATTGNITITGNTTFGNNVTTPASKTTINGTVSVSSGATFTPQNASNTTGLTTVTSGGSLDVAGPGISTYTTGGLTVTGNFNADLIGLTSGTEYDQVLVTGLVDVTGATLNLTTNVALSIGDSFTLISNDGTDAVVGTFAKINPLTNPTQVFTVNYTGGDGNDVVVTLSSIITGNVLNIASGVFTFGAAAGNNNNLTVSLSGGVYTITDTTGIGLLAGALSAGWTAVNANTVTGNSSTVNSLFFNTADGSDTITLNGLNDPFTILGGDQTGDTLNIAGNLAFTGNASISGFNSINNTATGLINSPTGTLTVTATAIGNPGARFKTTVATLIVSAGTSGAYIQETDGVDLTATVNGGVLDVFNTTGKLRIAGDTTTLGGNLVLSSNDGIDVTSNLNAGAGSITINANSDGVGTDGFNQSAGLITTTNTNSDATTITVNTTGGGTANLVIDNVSIGDLTGGTLNLNSNGGSILYAGTNALTTGQQGTTNGSSAPTRLIVANDYNFTATGTGSIGTASRPIQSSNIGTDALIEDSTAILNAGSGGVFFVDWSGVDLTLSSASTSGNGDILVVTGNVGGHNLYITGSVSAASGNIFLAADDNLEVGGGQPVTIGGAGFSGTITILANRDAGTNGQPISFAADTVLQTTNTTANAVLVSIAGDNGSPASTILVGNITVGNGGTITINAIPNGAANENGVITFHPGTVLNAGSTGTVNLITDRVGITGASDAIGTSTNPGIITAGTVNYTAGNGDVFLTVSSGTKVLGTHTTAGNLTLSSSSGAAIIPSSTTLTVPGIVTINGGTVRVEGTLTGTGGLTVSAGTLQIGDTATSGTVTSNITNNAAVVFNRSDALSYGGVISGTGTVTQAGTGVVTLTGTNTYTGATKVNTGTLRVNGSLAAGSTVTVATGATLDGTGTVNGTATVNGDLAIGAGSIPGLLTAGNLTLSSTGEMLVDVLGTTFGTNYDRVRVTGNVNLGGAALTLNLGSFIPTGGDVFVIISNEGANSVTGTFNGLAEGAILTVGTQKFTVSYIGGDGNDVTLTRNTTPVPTVTSVALGVIDPNTGDFSATAQRSLLTAMTVTFDSLVNITAGAFSLTGTNQAGTPFTGSPDITFTIAELGGVTVVTLTFSGANTENGSLADGTWILNIDRTKVIAVGTTNVTMAADFNTSNEGIDIKRLFGDVFGNGSVGVSELNALLAAFGSTAGDGNYNLAFDFDGSGIGVSALNRFLANFGLSL